jgi:hypothetical protein
MTLGNRGSRPAEIVTISRQVTAAIKSASLRDAITRTNAGLAIFESTRWFDCPDL